MPRIIHPRKQTILPFPGLWLPGSPAEKERSHPWHGLLPGSRGLGRRCCCESCTQFEDKFNRSNSSDLGADWSEEAGDWSISSGALVAAAGGAVATCQASLTLPYTIFCKVRGGSTSDTAKIIWNYSGTSDYSYLHVTFDNTVEWKIFEKVGGLDTEEDGETVSIAATSTDIYIAICITSTSATVSVSSTGALNDYDSAGLAAAIDTTLSECGVGTTVQAVGMTFDDFRIDTHSTADDNCFGCTTDCIRCTDSGPGQWKVVITGMAGGGTCGTFNGTWILHPTDNPCFWTTGPLSFVTDIGCSGTSHIYLRLHAANDFVCGDDISHNHAMKVTCIWGPSSAICTEVGCSSTFRHSQVGLFDCLNLTDYDLPRYSSPPYCDATGATCTVTAL